MNDIHKRLKQENDYEVFLAADGEKALKPMTEAQRRHEAANYIIALHRAGMAMVNARNADEAIAAEAAWSKLLGLADE